MLFNECFPVTSCPCLSRKRNKKALINRAVSFTFKDPGNIWMSDIEKTIKE